MWDAPVAFWDFFFPERDDQHQRAEVGRFLFYLRCSLARYRYVIILLYQRARIALVGVC